MNKREKVLSYYGAELFDEWTNEATFVMEVSYTADDYDIFWCHSAEELWPNVGEDLFYYVENTLDVFIDNLKAGESIYICEEIYDGIYVDDIFDEIYAEMEKDGEVIKDPETGQIIIVTD